VKLTADTIPDDQIREMREQLKQEDWYAKKGLRTWARVAVCNNALAGADAQSAVVREVRQRYRGLCAEILNARSPT
jgi:hypothetical protein